MKKKFIPSPQENLGFRNFESKIAIGDSVKESSPAQSRGTVSGTSILQEYAANITVLKLVNIFIQLNYGVLFLHV